MNRAERLAEASRRAKEKLAKDRKALAKIESAQHHDDRQARWKRRLVVGTLAEAAGLCALSNTDLAGLFALLGRVTQAPDPVAAMKALLHDHVSPVRVAVNGITDHGAYGPMDHHRVQGGQS
jgi:hypothetical protein